MQPPGISDMKKVDLCEKYRQFIPHELHYLICPKPDDSKIKLAKEQRKLTAKKRLERIKILKGEGAMVDDDGDIVDSMRIEDEDDDVVDS